MRKFLSHCLILFFILYAQANLAYGVHESNPYTFSITKHIYKLAEMYQIKSFQDETYPGTVKKSAFRVRTNYDLSNAEGWQATGITRIASLGTIYPWAKEIDIYDTRGVKIAFIDGEFATLESAKFTLYEYDEVGHAMLIGFAYASKDFTHFAVVPSMNDPRPLAELNSNPDGQSWNVTVHYPEKIDDRLIRIFAGFVLDYQYKFLS
ncbi:MAG: hypothetical protein K0S27_333 [Gammaproteobacteria bacterium]|jgi:hypothetical protein|nr:hypothetical protein [Gammaproteobacteria bacterium]